MKFEAKGGDFPQPDPDIYNAALVRMTDIGTRENKKFGGSNRVIVLTFELDATVEVDGKPQAVTIDRWCNQKISKKSTLRDYAEGWMGKSLTDEEAAEIDFTELMLEPVRVVVKHNDEGRAQVDSLMPGKKKIKATVKPYCFDLRQTDNVQIFDDLVPDYLQKKVQESAEYEVWSDAVNSEDHL